MCVEPGRSIAGEAGGWSPEWGSFLEHPTVADTQPFSYGDWQPSATAPSSVGPGCTESDPGSRSRRLPSALLVRRLARDVVAVAGVLRAGEHDVRVRRPDGRTIRAATGDGTFLAAVVSRRHVHETVVVSIASGVGRRRARQRIHTGPFDGPTGFETFLVRAGGRVVRVQWTGSAHRFVGVAAARVGGRLRLRPLERRPPSFRDDGSARFETLEGHDRCADVVLPPALGGVPVEPPPDAPGLRNLGTRELAAYRRRMRAALSRRRCARVQARVGR